MPVTLRRSVRTSTKPYDHPAPKKESATQPARLKKAAKPKAPEPTTTKAREQPISDDDCALILLALSQGKRDLEETNVKGKEEPLLTSLAIEPGKPEKAVLAPAPAAAAKKPKAGGVNAKLTKFKKAALASSAAKMTRTGGFNTPKHPSPLRKEVSIPRTGFPLYSSPSPSPLSSPSANPHKIILRIPTSPDSSDF